ncbi:hypothetical protein CKO23_16965 [Thiocystis violacea]|nr:hypothetical protein [Thiocystis violacea]
MSCLSGLVAWLCAAPAIGADWRGRLQDGSDVEVDPSTHRAWRTENGHRAPLWDGTHRLEDGSVVIVRDGTAVPNQDMIQTWGPRTPRAVLPDSSPCYELVDRVCGKDFRCSTSEPCRLANELVDLAKEALRGDSATRTQDTSADQCREAMGNAFFKPCE